MDRNTTPTRKKRKKRMRLPNGLGSVHLIGDAKSRRKPWRARVPSHVEIDEVKQTATQKYITIGYFENEADAIEALFNYRKNPYTLEAASATFTDVFEMWKAKKYPDFAKQSIFSYNSAYAKSKALHNMKMRDINASHLDNIMQKVSGGYQSQALLKSFWGQIYRYAMKHNIVQINYAQYVETRDKDAGTKRTAIPAEDIAKIWKAIDDGNEVAEIIMMYIYTGFRLTELLEIPKSNVDLDARMMVGGKKTAAGKNRKMPIHKSILPFVEKRMQTNNEYLIEGKNGKPLKGTSFARYYWEPLMKKLEIENCTAHYARHTFATMLRTAEIEEDVRKLLMGHATKDITDRYTHHPDEMLIEAMDKVSGRE